MSATSQQYRYHIPPKTLKSDCPQCGHTKKLSRYIDSKTGEFLPEIYGLCDRSGNCGYQLTPYDKGSSGLSYADEVYQRCKEEQQGLKPRPLTSDRRVVRQPATPAPIHSLPIEVFNASLARYEVNAFARFLSIYFGQGVAYELLSRFSIGTSSHWPGACVFWLQDEKNRIRGGQVILYDEAGHTAKRTLPDGTTKRCNSWVHYALAKRYKDRGEPIPDWLTTYMDPLVEKFPIPFGLHQLPTMPDGQAVAIVESAKTAIICSAYFPEFTWMASGSLDYLTLERMAPLRMKKLVLFPDVSVNGRAFDKWTKRAIELQENGFVVTVSDYLEQRATDEEKIAGLDMADYLLDQWKGYPPAWDDL